MVIINKNMDETYDVSSLALVQRKQYIKILSEVYGMDFFFLNEVDGNENLIQFLPFFVVRDRIVWKKIVSMPFDGGYGGPISLNSTVMDTSSWRYLVDYAEANGISSIEIRTRNSNDNVLQQIGFCQYKNLIGSELELTSEEEVWKRISKSHKSCIKKFIKKSYKISLDSTYEDVKAFYHIMSKNMRSFGTPMYPLSYFKKVWNEYHEEGNVILVKCMHGNKLIGGAFVLFNGEIAIYKYCFVDQAYIKDCVYHGIVWYIVQESIKRKCKFINFGTSFINDKGLIYFKSAFGAKSYEVYSYLYQKKKKKYHTVDEMREKYYGLIKIWRYLPLHITEWISNLFWRNFC